MDFFEEIKRIVNEKLQCSAHDLEHTNRVYKNCLKIAENEDNVDLNVLKTACLLHDIARVEEDKAIDKKIDHAKYGAELADQILKNFNVTEAFRQHVCDAIRTHRYRSDDLPKSIEAKILFDADKIDCLGAVGIARSYIIAGEYHESIYSNIDINEYINLNLTNKKNDGLIIDISKHSPNIEYQLKFVNIPNRLLTDTGKKLALERLEFMKLFFNTIDKEING